MPELPEVETVAAGLRDGGLVGCGIVSVSVRWTKTVARPGVAAFRKGLRGRSVVSVGRRAKFLLLGLDRGRTLLIHLRMTGHLFFAAPDEAPHGHQPRQAQCLSPHRTPLPHLQHYNRTPCRRPAQYAHLSTLSAQFLIRMMASGPRGARAATPCSALAYASPW